MEKINIETTTVTTTESIQEALDCIVDEINKTNSRIKILEDGTLPIPPIPILEPDIPVVVWAQTGEDKVCREDTRLRSGVNVINSCWDGTTAKQFGAKNEVVSFAFILEAGEELLSGLSIKFNSLSNGEEAINSIPVGKEQVFSYVDRNIELFHVRYVQITGLSSMGYGTYYGEIQVPEGLRMPPGGKVWADRPNADKFYPEIAVPIEVVGEFSISARQSQMIWADIYIPIDAIPGSYNGEFTVMKEGYTPFVIPVKLDVLPFALPDIPSAKTMLYWSDVMANKRFAGYTYEGDATALPDKIQMMHDIWNTHHLVAHRHKISLIGDGKSFRPFQTPGWSKDRWYPVLDGSLFTSKNGYDGPGVNTSSNVYSVGTYGGWWNTLNWGKDNQQQMQDNCNKIYDLFSVQFPNVQPFIYLVDEPSISALADVEKWAGWIKNNPGTGHNLKSFVTTGLPKKDQYCPSLSIAVDGWGDTIVWQPVFNKSQKNGDEIWAYNGMRPATGTFTIEDDGVSLRMLGWAQFKHKISRWFYWHANFYDNDNKAVATRSTDVFNTCKTFGGEPYQSKDGKSGVIAYNGCNGDGVLFYPGTDLIFPQSNYGVKGPFVSIRMKLWRRGLQDHDYLAMAALENKEAVDAIVQKMIPETLWEVGVTSHTDPSYVNKGISWSTSPDDWESARRSLATIIIGVNG